MCSQPIAVPYIEFLSCLCQCAPLHRVLLLKKKKKICICLQTTPMSVVVEQTTDGQIDAGEAVLLRVTLPLFSASWRHCWALTMKVHSPWITHSCSHIGGLNRWSQGYRQKRGSHSINSIPISSGRFLMVHLHTHTHTSPHTVLFLSCAPHWGPMWTIWSVYMASMPGGRSPQCPLCAHCENVWLRCVCVCVQWLCYGVVHSSEQDWGNSESGWWQPTNQGQIY